MTLSLYKKKRDFDKTPEPVNSKTASNGKLKFVVQKHDASHLHYDFRLEIDGALKSWAVPKGPSLDPSDKRLAIMVEDHPLEYGNFYGVIPEGNYGAGTVEIWDKGTYRSMNAVKGKEQEKILRSELKKGDIKITLNGHYLKGSFALVKIRDGKDKNWLLIKKKDKYAENGFKIDSIRSLKLHTENSKNDNNNNNAKDNSKNEFSRKAKKANLDRLKKRLSKPMLAKLSRKVFDDKNRIYEIKYDGYRIISVIDNGKAEMISRNGNNFEKEYEPVLKELETIDDKVILDGELLIEDKKGIPDFQMLQNYHSSKTGTLKYYVFDILFLNGYDLTGMPLINRKEILKEFFNKYDFNEIKLAGFKEDNGEKFFKLISKKGHEGIIAKEKDGLYYSGKRNSTWLKIKSGNQQEAVIGGYTAPKGGRKYFGSLIIGVYENDKLKYIGNCGTGFTDESLKELYELLKPLEVSKSPFTPVPVLTGHKGKPVWVKPELICNVKFSEWTNDGHMRHPVFSGLRTDKSPDEVLKETETETETETKGETETDHKKDVLQNSKNKTLTIKGKKVKLTNLDKLYWKKEKITKGDLIKYYIDVSKFILPYLKNRPESLNRHPNGINAPGFYQKDMDVKQIPDWVKTEKIYSSSNDDYIDYLICNNIATLVYMANLGCIEINPWNSVYSRPDKPDYMILDLDPGKNSFKEVVRTARVIKEVCDEIGINSYCKTSGATGLHIYFPLKAKYDYGQVRDFAKKLAEEVHSILPDITSTERAVKKRRNKIYLDYLQNSKGQTIAAPYSVRPRPNATVSAPLKWSEVNDSLKPDDFTIFNMQKRLEKTGDLWKDVLGKSIPLLKALKKLGKK